MVKEGKNYILGILIGIIAVLVVLFLIYILSNTTKTENKTDNLPFSSNCEYNLVGGQFGGTQGEDSFTCTFRNEGDKSGEKCFNIQEVKIDGAVETIIAEYKNICSGVLEPYHTSEKKVINEPQTYRDFDESKCSTYGQNANSWTCGVNNNREIEYIVRAEAIN